MSGAQMAGAWQVGGASARGAAHVRRDMPNQDAVLWAPRTGAARHFVAAVSDGHGAPAHYRSQVGARLAVESATAVLEWFLDGDTSDAAAAALGRDTLGAWQAAVGKHATTAATDAWVEPEADRLQPYGATLLAVAATDRLAVALQIGDGDLYLGYPDGTVARPLPDDQGLVGEQTHSLCSEDALRRFRVAVVRLKPGRPLPDFAMLSTDGVSKSFADEGTFRGVVEHYRRAVMTADVSAVLDKLPAWLDAVSQRGSGDDATLCLAAWKAA